MLAEFLTFGFWKSLHAIFLLDRIIICKV